MNKKNTEAALFIIDQIRSKGFKEDRYGNWKKETETGMYRYKFQATSYRVERLVDTSPPSWIRIGGKYYKDVKVE